MPISSLAGKRGVAKAGAQGRGGDTFPELGLPARRPERLLPVRFVPMLSPVLPLHWHKSPRLGRQAPLPEQFPWGGRILLCAQTLPAYARVPCRTVLVREFHHPLKLRLQCRQTRLREGNAPVLLPLAIVEGEDAGGAIALMPPQLQPCAPAQPAALQPLAPQGRGRRELLQDSLKCLPGEHNREVSRALRPGQVPFQG